MIHLLEELSLTAWPALQTSFYDGWVLRFADGYTRRANSVNPLYGSSEATPQKIAYCQNLYESHGQKTIFKLTPAVYPENLDQILAEQGFREDARTSVQVLDLNTIDLSAAAPITVVENQLSDEWLCALCRLNHVNPKRIPLITRLLTQIIPKTCYAALYENDEIVALGLGVVDRGYAGLFDIVTNEHHRNQGLGKQIMLKLLNWGRLNGAHHAYLQVMLNNVPAWNLYQKLGFREVYQYWYRVHL